MVVNFFNRKNDYLITCIVRSFIVLLILKTNAITHLLFWSTITIVLITSLIYTFESFLSKADYVSFYRNLPSHSYLSLNYLINYKFNIIYFSQYISYAVLKFRLFLKSNAFIVVFLFRRKSLWYPLFKKHSYLGFSRFTKLTNYK